MKNTLNWPKLTLTEKNWIRLDPYGVFASNSRPLNFHLKIFLLFLFPFLLSAQTKPTNPVLQSGWIPNCVRALPLHEGAGVTVDDMSPVNAACSLSPSANWDNDSEGNFVNTSLVSNSYISLASGLPGASIDSLTWYMRIKWPYSSTTGQTLGANFTNGHHQKRTCIGLLKVPQ